MHSRNITRNVLALFAIFALFCSGFAVADQTSDKWIHVKIDGEGDEKVTVNLPIALIGAAADMIPSEFQEQFHDETRIALDDAELSWGELRNFWEQVRDSPDATYVTVESDGEKIEVKRAGDYMLVESAADSKTQINVRFPMAAVDALLSGPDDTLDFKAALHVLAQENYGHLVSIRDGSTSVEVWIDDKNTVD